MKLKGNTILITGGATGIGFAFADRLAKIGNDVIICGRRKDKLEEAHRKSNYLHTIVSDISDDKDRKGLLSYVQTEFPEFNFLINNAGIQRKVDLTSDERGITEGDEEIEINFKAQIHVTAMFLPLLLKQQNAAIINVTSGLGLIPLSIFPIYSATKAAMHSYTLSLRHQLRNTNVKVFEVIPPTVYDTELKGGSIEKKDYSISSSELTDALIEGLEREILQIGAGSSLGWLKASSAEFQQIFSRMNS
jgi:uncharacterized oxidoreductase